MRHASSVTPVVRRKTRLKHPEEKCQAPAKFLNGYARLSHCVCWPDVCRPVRLQPSKGFRRELTTLTLRLCKSRSRGKTKAPQTLRVVGTLVDQSSPELLTTTLADQPVPVNSANGLLWKNAMYGSNWSPSVQAEVDL